MSRLFPRRAVTSVNTLAAGPCSRQPFPLLRFDNEFAFFERLGALRDGDGRLLAKFLTSRIQQSAPPGGMTEIRTERLRLRRARANDLEAMHAILADERGMAFWSTPPHREIGETRDWLQSMIDIPPGEGEDFIVEHAGSVIGKAGLYRFPEIGFILHPDHWGRGLAAEALAAVIERAFTVHHLDRIEADVDPRNARSLALLARLGFLETGRKAGTWQIGEQWCDSVYLRLRPDDWAAVSRALPRQAGKPSASPSSV